MSSIVHITLPFSPTTGCFLDTREQASFRSSYSSHVSLSLPEEVSAHTMGGGREEGKEEGREGGAKDKRAGEGRRKELQ